MAIRGRILETLLGWLMYGYGKLTQSTWSRVKTDKRRGSHGFNFNFLNRIALIEIFIY